MVTEPDRELPLTFVVPPHYDKPIDLKHGQVYILCNHLEVVEDLSFLQGRGRIGGPPNRKKRRDFIWTYGAFDTVGERLPDRRGDDHGRDMGRHQR